MGQAETHRRQFERRRIDIRVQITICERCAAQVIPVAGKLLTARMTDVSGGGAHLVTPTFLPRGTLIDLDVPENADTPRGRARARVMAVHMVDREPRYGLGLRFEETDSELVSALRAAEARQ